MSAGQQKKTFVVTRFDPDRDEVLRKQSYEIPVRSDWKVLDALNFIKDEIDATLSHRWSCRMAVCGSCGMMVDGEPRLTCKEPLSAIRHDQRCESVGSISSLMTFSASSTFQSGLTGTSYSCLRGASS